MFNRLKAKWVNAIIAEVNHQPIEYHLTRLDRWMIRHCVIQVVFNGNNRYNVFALWAGGMRSLIASDIVGIGIATENARQHSDAARSVGCQQSVGDVVWSSSMTERVPYY